MSFMGYTVKKKSENLKENVLYTIKKDKKNSNEKYYLISLVFMF